MSSWLKVVKLLLLPALCLYMGMVGVLFVFQRDLLFVNRQPETLLPQTADVPYAELIKVRTQDGLDLYGWYVPPVKPGYPVAVFFNGQGGVVSHLRGHLQKFHEHGYGALITSYRGYGGNPGAPSEEGIYRDARAFISWLEGKGVPHVFYGISLGTGVAVRMATEYPAQAVILQSPYSSIAEVAAGRFPLFPVRWLIRDRFDSLAVVGKVTEPVLMLMGRMDTVIPPEQAVKLYQAANQPKEMVWLDKSGHNDISWADIEIPMFAFLTRSAHENPVQ